MGQTPAGPAQLNISKKKKMASLTMYDCLTCFLTRCMEKVAAREAKEFPTLTQLRARCKGVGSCAAHCFRFDLSGEECERVMVEASVFHLGWRMRLYSPCTRCFWSRSEGAAEEGTRSFLLGPSFSSGDSLTE